MKIGIIQHICNNWQGKLLPYTQRRAEKQFTFTAEVGDSGNHKFCRNSELQLLAAGECAEGTRGGGREKIRGIE